MSQIQDLIQRGSAAAATAFGSVGELLRDGSVYWSGRVVWVETGGSSAVEYGGRVLTVDGRASIQAALLGNDQPKSGDRLHVNGKILLVTAVWKSSFDSVVNMECSQLT
jgi:hypothetical protein